MANMKKRGERDLYGTASLSGGSMRSVHGAEHARSACRATIKVKKRLKIVVQNIGTRNSRQSKRQLVEEPSGHDRAAEAPTSGASRYLLRAVTMLKV